VDIRVGVTITGLSGVGGQVRQVEFSDRTQSDADLVVIGVGISPRTELAEHLGLVCKGGIMVDSFSRTSNPSVVAAGDCTVFPSPVTGNGLVRLESVDNAISQARVAAATLLGAPQAYQGVPWFWSDQYDLKLQTAGLSIGHDSYITRGDPASEKFSVLYYKNGALCAVDAINHAADYIAVRRALSLGMTIDPEIACDPSIKLKELIGR
jgi:3-phenylpropionate/trans-cinnamate dioxygenase ferredoxin reductase subunit